MTGILYAGLANGILSGVRAGMGMEERRAERERLARAEARQGILDKQQAEYQNKLLDMRREEMDMQQQRQAEQTALQASQQNQQATQFAQNHKLAADAGLRADKQLQNQEAQQKVENTRNEALLTLQQDRANIEKQQADLVRQEGEIKIRTAKMQEQEALRGQAKQRLNNLLTAWNSGGKFDPNTVEDDYKAFVDATSLKPEAFLDGTVDRLTDTVTRIHNGQMDLNAPEALQAVNDMFGARIQRNLNEGEIPIPGTDKSGVVIGKKISRLFQRPDDPRQIGAMVTSYVKDKDGQIHTYEAPMTEFGTNLDYDPAVLIDANALSGHAAALLKLNFMFKENPTLRNNLIKMSGGGKDAKEKMELDRLEAQIRKEDAGARKAEAEARTVGTDKKGELTEARIDQAKSSAELNRKRAEMLTPGSKKGDDPDKFFRDYFKDQVGARSKALGKASIYDDPDEKDPAKKKPDPQAEFQEFTITATKAQSIASRLWKDQGGDAGPATKSEIAQRAMDIASGKTPAAAAASQGLGKDYGYGQRADGTNKGRGYYGEIKNPDGSVSTEVSVGVNIDGKEMEIPLLVPGLSQKEIETVTSSKNAADIPEAIIDKAIAHAEKRLKDGKSPFADEADAPVEKSGLDRVAGPAQLKKKYGGQAPGDASGFQEGQLYEDKHGRRRIYQNGKFVPYTGK